MTRYLLDTNTLSALVRPTGEGVRRRMDVLPWSDTVYTSVIVAAEVRFGLGKRASPRLTIRMEEVLAEIAVAPFTAPGDRRYADLRVHLERLGTPIGANDLWIAAQALQDDSVLVTDNTKEFGRVPDLKIENWLRL